MAQVEKLSIEIEAVNNVGTGIKDVQDDLTGFRARIKEKTAIDLSLEVGKIKVAIAQQEAILREYKKRGDKAAQVQLTADITILKQRLTQANRELTNFARTGQRDVSVLGKLFSGVYDRVDAIGASVRALGVALTAKLAKDSVKKFFDASGSSASKFAGEVNAANLGFQKMQVQVGGTLWNTVNGFFKNAGSSAGSFLGTIGDIISSIIFAFGRLGSVVTTFADSFAIVVGTPIVATIQTIQAIPQAVKAAFGKAIDGINAFAVSWTETLKGLPLIGDKMDFKAPQISNPFAGTEMPDVGGIWTSAAKKGMGGLRKEGAEFVAEWKTAWAQQSGVNELASKQRLKGEEQRANKAAEARKKQEEEDKKSVERVEELRKKYAEAEEKRIARRKDIFKDAYGTITSELEKAQDAVKSLDDKLADSAKKRADEQKDATKALGERYVEIQAALKEVTAGEKETTAEELQALMKEKAVIEGSTTQAQRDEALKYGGLTKAEQIIYDRDVAIKAIDEEVAALKLKRDEEIAAAQAVSDAKVKLERMFTEEFGLEIQKQLALNDQMVAKLREVEQAARAAAAAKASAGLANVTTNNVTVNNDVRNSADAVIVTDKLNQTLSR
jgi:hypothetical protein